DVVVFWWRGSEAHNPFVELFVREGLSQQQFPPGLNGEIGGRERAGPIARFQKRRAGAVNDVDGFKCHDVCSLGGMAAGIATCGGVGEIARKVVYGYHAVAQNIASLQQGVLFVSNATCRIHGISNITHVSGGVASQPPGTMILPDLPFCWL